MAPSLASGTKVSTSGGQGDRQGGGVGGVVEVTTMTSAADMAAAGGPWLVLAATLAACTCACVCALMLRWTGVSGKPSERRRRRRGMQRLRTTDYDEEYDDEDVLGDCSEDSAQDGDGDADARDRHRRSTRFGTTARCGGKHTRHGEPSPLAPLPAALDAPLIGLRVRVRGLSSRFDLNGLVGVAIAYSPAQSRYTVNVGGQREIAIKPSNLVRIE